ncbi:hypothetical protein SBV1_170014 [Verrucomicrobia bacterium]|nr:hypothetical protein SBV1_170014 [Verrucomicrobiota bacterium]
MFHRLGQMLRLHPGMAGVKHPHSVPMLAQDRSKRLDPKRRKRHDFNARTVVRRTIQLLREHVAEVIVSNVNQEDIHRRSLACSNTPRGWRPSLVISK